MTLTCEDANSKLVDIDFRGEERIDTAEMGKKLAHFLGHLLECAGHSCFDSYIGKNTESSGPLRF